MKLTPFWLFIILLIVLILSVIFTKKSRESFVGFYGSTASNTANLTIPQYANPVYKLYDNDYFDPKNGNILRVYGSVYSATADQDTAGTTIDQVDLINRGAIVTKFDKGKPITGSTLTSVPNSYHTWTVYSTDPAYSAITSNQLIYSAWGQDTYIHIIDLNNGLNACGFLFGPSYSTPIYINFNDNLEKLGAPKHDKNSDNDSYVTDEETGQILYQFTSHIFYVAQTGDLMFTDKAGIKNIYGRNGSFSNSFSTAGEISTSTKSMVKYDTVGNHMVLYVPNNKETTIIVMALNSDMLTYKIVYTRRFSSDGSLLKDADTIIKIGDVNTGGGGGDSTKKFSRHSPSPAGGSHTPSSSNSHSSRVWDIDFNTDTVYTDAHMNDYIKKTSIIPPICPTCPNCPSIGTCNSCGNSSNKRVDEKSHSTLSDSGTLHDMGSDASGIIKDTSRGTASVLNSVGGDISGLVKGGASGLKDTAESLGSGLKSSAESLGSGLKSSAESLGSGLKSSAESLGSGLKSSAEDLGSGTKSFLNNIGNDVKGIFTDNERGQGFGSNQGVQQNRVGQSYGGGEQSGYGSQGTGPQNPFTYNGALTERPTSQSNYVPLTTDFSKFGR
jgi:hypothetical protein